jgi:NAD(P)-dependent dehydrogenase (short-subunit alcohol dehydrogenase family)
VTPAAGRVAVVTGASRGLGQGLALHFATSGLQLGVCARTRPKGPEPAVRAAVDVTDPAALAQFADQVVARFGRIDLWVNNAGLLHPIGPLAEADPAAVARNVEVNVTGVLHGSAVFARHVRSRPGGGVLVNISSGAATTPYAGWAAYCAGKAAVDQLTRVVALEEAAHGLSAYALSPGVVDTDMQALIRRTDEADFPAVPRFRQLAVDGTFNSAGWVAEHLLRIAFGGERPDDVVVRVPDQPVPGAAG